MCHQCRICPVLWLGCPYISKVTMTLVMTMTLTTMSLSATTTKMPGTISTEGSCEACCQRDGHPSTFPLIMCTVWCSNAWLGLMGPVANARGIKFHLRELSPETGGQYTGMPVGDVVRSVSLGVRYHGDDERRHHKLSILYKRHLEVSLTTIRTPDYGVELLPCCALVGFDANSLYPWAGARHGHGGLPCQEWARLWPGCWGHVPRLWSVAQQGFPPMAGLWGRSPQAGGPVACRQRAGNGPKVWLDLRHLPMDGYHPDTTTVFQFHCCLFHCHDCHEFEDT